jgi:Tfp pilus assembly protein PilO
MNEITPEDFQNGIENTHQEHMMGYEKHKEKVEHKAELEDLKQSITSVKTDIVNAVKSIPTKMEITNFPEEKEIEFPTSFSVSNLQDYNNKIDEVTNAIKAIKVQFDPKIEVKASDVIVEQDFTALEKKLEDVCQFISKIKIDIPKIDVKPTDVKVVSDFTKLETKLGKVIDAVRAIKLEYPEQDNTEVIKGLARVTKAINSLSFPSPNYVLPYKNVQGAATQVQLNPDGSVPVANNQLPTAGNNPATALGYTGSNLTTLTKTINGVQYRKTLAYTGAVLDTVSAWVQL